MIMSKFEVASHVFHFWSQFFTNFDATPLKSKLRNSSAVWCATVTAITVVDQQQAVWGTAITRIPLRPLPPSQQQQDSHCFNHQVTSLLSQSETEASSEEHHAESLRPSSSDSIANGFSMNCTPRTIFSSPTNGHNPPSQAWCHLHSERTRWAQLQEWQATWKG